MNGKNKTMTLWGFDTTHPDGTNLYQDQPFSDCSNANKHHGMPITPASFCKMLGRFRNSPAGSNPAFKHLWWVEFSKASIFRVLAQEECEYVRFYFVKPEIDKEEASLCMQGIDANGNTIKRDVLEEVSKKMTDPAFNPNGKLNEIALMDSLDSRQPATEEKGNGGVGSSFMGDGNVKSIQDFYQSQKDNHKEYLDMDLATFIKDFLDYADGKK